MNNTLCKILVSKIDVVIFNGWIIVHGPEWQEAHCLSEGIPESQTNQPCSSGLAGFSKDMCNVVGGLSYAASFSNPAAAVRMASVLS